MRVGFAKVGQRIQLDRKAPNFQGAAAPANLLFRLARRNPGVEWVLVGHHAGSLEDWPVNVVTPWSPDLAAKQAWHNSYDENGARQLALVNPAVKRFEDEVVIPLIASLDGMVVVLGSNTSGSIPIPKTKTTWADNQLMKPMEAMLNTGRYIVEGLNALGDRTDGKAPVIWLCEDPRNLLKMRDLKWPTGTGCLHEATLKPEMPDSVRGFGPRYAH